MQTSEKMAVRTRDGGTMNCHVAKPNKESAPAIIIIQEIFGITPWLKSTADWLAGLGYYAVVPDMFWRLEPGLDLDSNKEQDLQKAFGLYGQFDKEKGIEDFKDLMQQLKENRSVNGKIGCMGYCLGGLMSYRMACAADIDCTVSYYGGEIDRFLDEGKNIKKPTMLHIPADDAYITPDKQAKIKEALSKNPNVAIHVYPGVGHAFCRVSGDHYNKEAADLANSRTVEFFNQSLT
jgi:carboxymethylenebutenolidase